MNVEMIDDGTRFYVIIKNPSEEEKSKTIDLVSKLFNINKDAKKQEGIIPVKVETPKVSDQAKKIDPDVIEKEKPGWVKIGYVNSVKQCVECLTYDALDEAEEKTLINRCSNFLAKKYMKQINENNIADIKKFILDFKTVMAEEINISLANYGYSDLKMFLSTAGENEIKSLYQAGKKRIFERLKIKKTD
ncbi:hypothetical protein [Hungatella hathewayi]|uniref:hypothetical protein n=1 Tax=Hungatella hathewayi TaxID=154046 RepID=UPI003561B2EA